jgi:hypothetical protein
MTQDRAAALVAQATPSRAARARLSLGIGRLELDRAAGPEAA